MAAASSRFGAPSLRRMCETWTPAVRTLEHQGGRDLAVGVATGDESQDLRLPRRQAEDLLKALYRSGSPASGGAGSARARWASSSSCRPGALLRSGLRRRTPA